MCFIKTNKTLCSIMIEKGKKRKNMVTKQDILDETYLLFAEKGYYLSMSDIAKQVGLKVPSIYSHFQSKDEIIYCVMENKISTYYTTLLDEIKQSLQSDVSTEKRLRQICFSVSDYFSNQQTLRFWKNISLIYHEELRVKCRELVKRQDELLFELLRSIFEIGSKKCEITVKEESVEGGVLLFWTMMQGILDMILIQGGMHMSYDTQIPKIWQAYWDGLVNNKIVCK
jgi:AcrR family transcriptional regulator